MDINNYTLSCISAPTLVLPIHHSCTTHTTVHRPTPRTEGSNIVHGMFQNPPKHPLGRGQMTQLDEISPKPPQHPLSTQRANTIYGIFHYPPNTHLSYHAPAQIYQFEIDKIAWQPYGTIKIIFNFLHQTFQKPPN